jgi:hypothetical protein
MEDARETFRADMLFRCPVPRCKSRGSDIHEITRGSGIREAAYQERAAWLFPCRAHHDEFGDYAIWPLARQYALKALVDFEHYDRVLLNTLRGRAADSIDEMEVLRHIVEFFRTETISFRYTPGRGE